MAKEIMMANDYEQVFMEYYRELRDLPENDWLIWADPPKSMKRKEATKFIVGVMLDQQQKVARAWEGGEHLVENYFGKSKSWWATLAETELDEVKDICRTGFHGKSYAVGFPANAFPVRLHENAHRMVERYDGDPRNIWTGVDAQQLYSRFREFAGIGEALAKMATFLLVRGYGVAGGKAARKTMQVKPDEHVRRVSYRLGLAPSTRVADVVRAIDELDLASPADFDAALFLTGQRFCHKRDPACFDCPGGTVCRRTGL